MQDENDLIVHQKHKHFKCLFCPKRLSSSKALNVHSVQVHKKPITEIPESKPGREDPKWEIFGSTGIPPGMKRGGDPPAQPGPVPNQAIRPGFPPGPYRPGPMLQPPAGPAGVGRVPPVAGGPYPVVRPPPAYGIRPGPGPVAAGPQQFPVPGVHRQGMPYAMPPGGFPPPLRPGQHPYPYQPGGAYPQPYRPPSIPSQVAGGPAKTTYSARPTITSVPPTAGSSAAAAATRHDHKDSGIMPGSANE